MTKIAACGVFGLRSIYNIFFYNKLYYVIIELYIIKRRKFCPCKGV